MTEHWTPPEEPTTLSTKIAGVGILAFVLAANLLFVIFVASSCKACFSVF
jgi:hypothetical protein